MPYDDGAQTTVLYTKGTKGDDISEELRQFLSYMENTTQTNAVNDTLKDIQKMVDIVKRDGEVSLSYMKGFERDTIMYEKGQAAERKNTERERILLKKQGIQLIVADRFYPSSKLCSCCGNIKKALKLSDRVYRCECGNMIDRDFQASINLKTYGEQFAS